MTTTSPARVRTTRIGPLSVLVTLLAALLTALAFPAPAHASHFVVQPNPGSVDITTGQGGQSIEVTLQNTVPKADGVNATVALEGLDNLADVSVEAGECSGVNGNTVNCGSLSATDKRVFSVTINPNDNADLAEGDSRSGTLKVTMDGPNQGNGAAGVNVIGGKTASITGTVNNFEDEPLADAAVKAEYSDGSKDETTSGEDGKYTLEDAVEGEATLTVAADGFADYEESVNVSTGEDSSLTVQLSPEEEASDKQETQEANVAGTETDEADTSGLSGTSIVLMMLGVLLIVGAIVAIVMLIRKGRAEKREDETPERPSTPPVHNPSATQTGQLGVYDSAARPGMDSPTMIHNGPLVRDGERSRPSNEPVSGGYPSNAPVSSGFGPAYAARHEQAGSTQRYPSADANANRGNSHRDAAVGGYSHAPTSGGYRGNEPASGHSHDNAPTSGSYGYGSHHQPTSGAYRDPHDAPPTGYHSQEPTSGSYGYGSHHQPTSGGYRGNEPASGHSHGNAPTSGSYGYQSEAGYHSDQGHRGDYTPRQSRPRRYRDDDDDRPQSW